MSSFHVDILRLLNTFPNFTIKNVINYRNKSKRFHKVTLNWRRRKRRSNRMRTNTQMTSSKRTRTMTPTIRKRNTVTRMAAGGADIKHRHDGETEWSIAISTGATFPSSSWKLRPCSSAQQHRHLQVYPQGAPQH